MKISVALIFKNLKCFLPVISEDWFIVTMAENENPGIDPALASDITGNNAEAAIIEMNKNSAALLNTTNVLTDLLLQLPDKLTASISSFLVQRSNIPSSASVPASPKATITG